jgi:lactoylglutathione lyase
MADGVLELRLVVTAGDCDAALRFCRDALGLPEIGAFDDGTGRASILDAGQATLELSDVPHAEHIDRLEVGRRVAGQIRVAFGVADAGAPTDALAGAGAQLIAPPVETPWRSLNARLDAPAGLQLTPFAALEAEASA